VQALRVPANAEILEYAPHADLMARALLVVCHGGHGTSMAALGHDLPLVIMPVFALGDQPAVGRALARLGATRVLPKAASPEQIAEAMQELLPEGPYREAARALGARIRQRDGADAAADALEAVLVRSQA
jgi:UDP:flavonoid glycosyltransferase YjiC (YdhE family)